MSNEAHYDLERRLAVKFGEMDANELRRCLIEFVTEGSVGAVRLLATCFDVSIDPPQAQR